MLSLLYRTGGEIPHADERLIAELLLDQTFAAVTPNLTRRTVFLSVLTSPLTGSADLAYRRDILHDFLAEPNLCEALRTELDNLTRLRETAQRERSQTYAAVKSVSNETAFRSNVSVAVIFAETMKEALHILSQIAVVLGMYNVRSEGLVSMKRRAEAVSQTEGSGEVTELCQLLSDYGTLGDGNAAMTLALNDEGRAAGCELTFLDVTPVETADPKPSFLRKFFAKAPSAPPIPGVRIDDTDAVLKNALFGQSFHRVCELIDGFLCSLFDEFSALARELCFYETAAAYVNAMKEKNVPLCTPVISEETELSPLYDLLLCVSRPNAATVVPNGLHMAKRAGVLLTGENNSGKTVFLRSFGTAQLLFQAGLPIPCESARMRIVSAVCTRFAASEKEPSAGIDAGRFENEVRELVPLIEEAKPGSLLLLNEIFQTTSYREGAQGLYHILRYLSERGVSFLLVTHLKQLTGLFGDDAVHLTTAEGYRVIEAD